MTNPELRWTDVAQATLKRPYPVTIPMVVLVSLVPLYIFIAEVARGRTAYRPALPLDEIFPMQPVWALVYGALYLFLIVLPIFAVRQEEQIRRTVYAYLLIWITAYVCFLAYPTIAPRTSDTVIGTGFAAAGLRALYGMDPPYNCFPSLHVAHSFVSALTLYRLHRRVGLVALLCAALVAVSTLYTKQHYVLDVIAGALLAYVAYVIFLRNYKGAPELDRRLAPPVALGLAGIIGLIVFALWAGYRIYSL